MFIELQNILFSSSYKISKHQKQKHCISSSKRTSNVYFCIFLFFLHTTECTFFTQYTNSIYLFIFHIFFLFLIFIFIFTIFFMKKKNYETQQTTRNNFSVPHHTPSSNRLLHKMLLACFFKSFIYFQQQHFRRVLHFVSIFIMIFILVYIFLPIVFIKMALCCVRAYIHYYTLCHYRLMRLYLLIFVFLHFFLMFNVIWHFASVPITLLLQWHTFHCTNAFDDFRETAKSISFDPSFYFIQDEI